MFTSWYATDPDCYQHMRSDGSLYEMVQAVWLDLTEDDIANGYHKFCIVRMTIDLNDYSDEEKELHLSSYGYTLRSIVEEYGDAADRIIAECVMESEILSDAYVVDDADSIDEVQEKIMNILFHENKEE